MRLLFHANVDFAAWTAHVAAAMARRVPDFSAEALVTLDAGTAEALRRQPYFPFSRVESLTEFEAAWLAAGDGEARLAALEARLGASVLREIGIADREISGFAMPHATFAETPLKRATRDPAKRAAYLASLVDFLDTRLAEGDYDAVVATSLQDAPGMALAHLAQARGIPFLSPKAIGFRQITSLFDDPRNMRPTFRHLFERVRAGEAGGAAILARGAEIHRAFRQRPESPDYMASPINSPLGWPRAIDSAALAWRSVTGRAPENLRYPYPASRLWHDWRRALEARQVMHSASFAGPETLEGAPFIYFPLHYEPEASLLVSAPHETDQVAVIRRLAAALPAGWRLSVKEHRPMLGRRPAGFYDMLAGIEGVTLVSPLASGFSFTHRAALTATITGTAGLEAVLLGKPVLFLGDHPIQIIGEGFVRAGLDKDIAAAMSDALQVPPARDEVLAAFLGAMAEDGLDFPSAEIWSSLASLSFERVAQHTQAIDRMAELLLEALQRG